jgi:rhodanese-related sulfurtransferase
MPRRSNRRARHSSRRTLPSSRRNTRIFLFAGLAVLIIALLAGISFVNSSGYPRTISPARAQNEIAKGALVLDVRERAEYSKGHITGSTWIPLGELSLQLQELPRDRLIIVVCLTGAHSAQGVNILLAAGFSQVTSLAGGITAWGAAGYTLTVGEPSTP